MEDGQENKKLEEKAKDNGWPLLIPSPRDWHHTVKEIISFLGIILAIILAIGIVYLLADIVRLYFSPDIQTNKRFGDLRTSLLIFAALVGVPFFLWRTWIAQSQSNTAQYQAETARDRAYTELFTKAIEQLGAEKLSIEYEEKEEGESEKRETYVPNLEVRIGAIYALERIMHDSKKDAEAIVDTLAAYIRENCGEPESFKCEIPQKKDTQSIADWVDDIKWKVGNVNAPAEGTIVARAHAFRANAPANRTDIKTTLTVLGRRPDWLKGEGKKFPDLRDVNFQGADLLNFDFEWMNLTGAQMQGAVLRNAKMQGADLSEAKMQGAILSSAQMQGSVLRNAQMQGAVLTGAQMQGVHLDSAEMQGAFLDQTQIPRANLSFALMQGVYFRKSNLKCAYLSQAKMQLADLEKANLQRANLTFAEMQGTKLYNAQMQGANLWCANMKYGNLASTNMRGTNLDSVEIDEVHITSAEKLAASVLGCDFTKADCEFEKLQTQLPDMFGHKKHTILPKGMDPPEHWSEADIFTDEGREQYYREWEDFKKEKGVE